MWNYAYLDFYEKLFGFGYLIVLISLLIVPPRKNIVYFLLLSIGIAPFFYWLIMGIMHKNKAFDVFFPIIAIFSLLSLLYLSLHDQKR